MLFSLVEHPPSSAMEKLLKPDLKTSATFPRKIPRKNLRVGTSKDRHARIDSMGGRPGVEAARVYVQLPQADGRAIVATQFGRARHDLSTPYIYSRPRKAIWPAWERTIHCRSRTIGR